MLTSLQNPLVKQIRRLHHAKYRRQQASFLLEGTHLLQEAIATTWPLEVVCATPIWQVKQPQLWAQIQPIVPRIELVSPEVLAVMATTVQPDGVVAIATSRPQSLPRFTQLGLVLDQIQDPGNLGTMIRTAAAAGAEGILLSENSVDLENPKVLRASAGTWFRLPLATASLLLPQLQHYQREGLQVVATTPTAPLEYWQVDLRRPTLVLVGNEAAGLSKPLLQLADQQVRIPLAAGVESLNAAIAAALLLYEAQRQRHRLTEG
jgi:TrmH family RNA methyltransferase